jgi:hypothetical protein
MHIGVVDQSYFGRRGERVVATIHEIGGAPFLRAPFRIGFREVHVEWMRAQLVKPHAQNIDVIRLLYVHACQHVIRVCLHGLMSQESSNITVDA